MQLAYCLDSATCSEQGVFFIELHLVDSSGKLINTQNLPAQKLLSLSQFSDQPLLPLLQAKLKAIHSGQIPRFSIDSSELQKVLKLMTATGRLFFRSKRLFCDFFGHATLLYHLTKKEREWYLFAEIRDPQRSHPLRECEALRSSCYIKNGQLRFFDKPMNWKQLNALFEQTTFALDNAWKELLRPKWEEEPSLFIIENGTPEQLWGVGEPLPVLVLSDKTGGFAKLMMDYGTTPLTLYDRSPAATRERRNRRTEKDWEKDLLETDYSWKPTGNSHYYCPIDKVPKSLSFLLELGWKVQDSKGETVTLIDETSIAVRERGPKLIIEGTIRYGDQTLSIQQAIGAFNRREHFMSIGNGVVALLPQTGALKELADISDDGECVADGIAISKTRIGLLEGLKEHVNQWELSDNFKSLCSSTKQQLIHATPLGSGFVGNLRAYQQEGVDWLHFLYSTEMHGLLADDMGLGKTVQLLAFLSTLPEDKSPHLVALPTTLLHNWSNEIRRFLPGYSYHLHHGPQRAKKTEELPNCSLIITSYALLRLDAPLFKSLKINCLILDEAHFVKNSSTQLAQTIYTLDARFRLSITGTPIENNLKELWSHFHFLLPGLLGNRESFEASAIASHVDPRFLEQIKRKVRPFILRRTKQQVAPDLPPKIEQITWVEMGTAQRELYENFLGKAKGNLLQKVRLDGTQKHRFEILEVLLRLRQICCHPLLTPFYQHETTPIESAKFEALLSDLEELAAEGAKVLVYSQFTSFLKLIAKALSERNYSYCYLDGETKERAAAVETFQLQKEIPFFLISLKAGGVGLNLTAADYVLLVDPWWNEAAEQQAIDRAHRIGRTAPIIAKRYVMTDTIEEKIMKLKEQKCSLAKEIMGDETGSLSLTTDDFLWLLDTR